MLSFKYLNSALNEENNSLTSVKVKTMCNNVTLVKVKVPHMNSIWVKVLEKLIKIARGMFFKENDTSHLSSSHQQLHLCHLVMLADYCKPASEFKELRVKHVFSSFIFTPEMDVNPPGLLLLRSKFEFWTVDPENFRFYFVHLLATKDLILSSISVSC